MSWNHSMMEVNFQCRYCGHIWNDQFFSQDSIEYQRCSKCGDEDLIVREKKDLVIDAYVGCPPFPKVSILLAFLLFSTSSCAFNRYVHCTKAYQQYESFEKCYYSEN